MRKITSPLCAGLVAIFMIAEAAHAQTNTLNWNAEEIVYCSDGSFDWESGQSLYDFVILKRTSGDFIVSYLGIPFPSFERRRYEHLWIKLLGFFSASYQEQGAERVYSLKLELDEQPARTGDLVIAADGKYTFSMTPSLGRPLTEAGLCWDSLDPEPRELQNKRR